MIGYYGLWGQGKTLSVVANTYKRFKKNPDLVIFTNLPLDLPPHPKTGQIAKQFYYKKILELRQFFLYAANSPHELLAKETIVIIDEASVVLSSRTFAQLPAFMISFLAQARHINTDFIFTTQGIMRVEKIVRELTEHWIQCKRIPLIGWILHEKQYATLVEGRVYARINKRFLTFPKKYYGMYDTYHLVDFGEHQVKASEKAIKPTRKLENFLISAYESPPAKKTFVNSLKNSIELLFSRFTNKKTPDQMAVEVRDKIFFNINNIKKRK